MFDPISLVMSLASAVPSIVKFVQGDNAIDKAAALVDAAKAVTGKSDPTEAIADVAADPTKLLEFKQRVMELQLEETKALLADVADARSLQAEALAQDDVFAKRFIYYFAIAWSLFAMIYFTWATFGTITNQRFADTILGFLLGTAIAGIFQFFYGSSARSAKKDDVIHAMTRSAK